MKNWIKKMTSSKQMAIKNETGSSINNGTTRSIIVDVGSRTGFCGYCKSGYTKINYGFRTTSLTVYDYQALLDRGWRRSGCYLYKPEMEKTCCPPYTIRLKANDFVPSKEQVRVSKRMQRFLDGSLNVEKPDEESKKSSDLNNIDQGIDYLGHQIDSVVFGCTERGEFPEEIQFPKACVKSITPANKKLQAEAQQDLLYSSNISFQISAALRRANKSVVTEKDPKFIADVLSSHLNNSASAIGLSVKACDGHINFYSTVTQARPDVTDWKPEVSKGSSSNNFANFEVKKHNLEIRLKRSTFDLEEYELYRRYQIKVHNDRPDQINKSSYKRFLIDSPLIFVPSSGDSLVPPSGFGSFHQQYLINGKLVAVGVIDILPKCLSSKYLFWDPDLAFLSLGKYSALQEINWVKESQTHCPSLQYYYLGYYIHSCSKMRYKAAYRPSELLCPLRYQWVSYDIAKRLLDRKEYAVLSDFATLRVESVSSLHVTEDQTKHQDETFSDESNDISIDMGEEMSKLSFESPDDELGPEMQRYLGNIIIGLKGMHKKYKDILQTFGPNERNHLETRLDKYVKAVGIDLSERMIYSIG